MRALVYYGPKDIRLEHGVPEPVCGPNQVKIRPAFVGICGTDLHEFQAQSLIPARGCPHPLTGQEVPVILGHEFSGIVVELGSDAARVERDEDEYFSDEADPDGLPRRQRRRRQRLKVGDRVAVQPTLYCRECDSCRGGWTNCCESLGFLGISGSGGGLSDFVCADWDAVFRIPEHIPLEVGALVEPLSVAWHAVKASGLQPGENALVMGTGPIGLAVIQCLRAVGARVIFAAEVASERQEYARKFGADLVFDPAKTDVVSKVRQLNDGGGGVPVAFDCAGAAATLDIASRAVSARGTVVNAAIWEKPIKFDPNNIIFHEKKLLGSLCFTRSDFDQVIEALGDGTLHPDSMITGKIRMEHVVEDGFMALIHEKDKHVKVLVDLT